MVKRYLTILIILTNTVLFGEIISEGIGLRYTKFASSLKKQGYYINLDYENLFLRSKDSTMADYFNRTSLSFDYGLLENLDMHFAIPYSSFFKPSKAGFNDLTLGLKYSLAQKNLGLTHALSLALIIPSGRNNYLFSYKRKVFDGTYLLDYRKEDLGLHFNLGLTLNDHFKVDNEYDSGFYYRLGFDYLFYNYQKKNFRTLFEFETLHSMHEYPDHIKGSIFGGFKADIYQGLAGKMGYIKELYDSDYQGFMLNLSYSHQGFMVKETKKLFENYRNPLKIGVIQLENDDTLKIREKVTDKLVAHLKDIDSLKISDLDYQKFYQMEAKDSLLTAFYQKNNLILYGKINSQKFKQSSAFYLPPLISLPEMNYEVKATIFIYDSKKNKLVYHEDIEGRESILGSASFLTFERFDELWILNSIEKRELMRKAKINLAKNLLKKITNKTK